jgi:chemotaxis protein histidine kinase CheA
MSDGNARIFTPPNMLRAKVGNKPGPDLDQIVAKAEAALIELKDDYEVWIRGDLKTLREAVASLRQKNDPATLERIKIMGHEIKGQGATYGYPLLTTVGHLLYTFIEMDANVAAQNLDLIDAHVDFMALILAEKIDDEGGLQAQGILAGLQDAAKRAHGDHAQLASASGSAT